MVKKVVNYFVDFVDPLWRTQHVEIIKESEQRFSFGEAGVDCQQCPVLSQAEEQRHERVTLLAAFSLGHVVYDPSIMPPRTPEPLHSEKMRSEAPTPSIDTTVVSSSRLVNAWVTASVPALVDRTNWNGELQHSLEKLLGQCTGDQTTQKIPNLNATDSLPHCWPLYPELPGGAHQSTQTVLLRPLGDLREFCNNNSPSKTTWSSGLYSMSSRATGLCGLRDGSDNVVRILSLPGATNAPSSACLTLETSLHCVNCVFFAPAHHVATVLLVASARSCCAARLCVCSSLTTTATPFVRMHRNARKVLLWTRHHIEGVSPATFVARA